MLLRSIRSFGHDPPPQESGGTGLEALQFGHAVGCSAVTVDLGQQFCALRVQPFNVVERCVELSFVVRRPLLVVRPLIEFSKQSSHCHCHPSSGQQFCVVGCRELSIG